MVAINAQSEEVSALSDDEIRQRFSEYRQQVADGTSLDDVLVPVFALVREAATRTVQLRPYDVQLVGGIVLHRGQIAEMRTGEGKTLVATLPVALNALNGKGVHVITVNDYLAKRDAQWMGQVYDFLGLSVAIINSNRVSYIYDSSHEELDDERDEMGSFKVYEQFLRPCSRAEAYQADIVYGTNNEFGFDYLRDNTQQQPAGIVQREHAYAVVDEIDSILVDEARVPLILSAAAADAEGLYKSMRQVAGRLEPETDYTVDEKLKAIQLTDEGIRKAEQLLKIDNIYTAENMKLVHHLETAVRATALFQRDTDYVVREGQVIIVDPFTGRMQEGRRWSDGLHQAVEAKEGVTIQQESKTLASITYQNYFKFYQKLSGMTGTAVTSAEEFDKVYGLEVVVIPTHKPIARIDHTDLIFQTRAGKLEALTARVKEIHETGQPILIGTVSIEDNEALSAQLTLAGVTHQVLNAKQHEAEGMIVAQAGAKGAVTIATNMAGRGVDIKLGGNPTTPADEAEIKELGGLFVIGTERHESRRIDNQLRGRAGRQGDPGATQFLVSMDDNLMRVFGGDRVKSMMGTLGIPENEPITNKFISRQLEKAQERIEGFHFDARKHTLEYDDILAYHRNLIYTRRRRILFDDKEFITDIYNQAEEYSPELREQIIAKKTEMGEEQFDKVVKRVALHVIDRLWMEHLEVMEGTRRSVNLRAYGQREPLVEYKKESLRLFQELEDQLRVRLANILARIDVQAVSREQVASAPAQVVTNESDKKTVRVAKDGSVKEVKKKNLDDYLATGWKIME